MKKLVFVLICAMGLTACGINDESANNPDDDTFVDGELTDITERNPNFLNLNDNDGNTNNRGILRAKIREAAEQSTQFQPQAISLTGARATVNVRAVDTYTEEDLQAYQEHIQRAMPRYDIHVRVR